MKTKSIFSNLVPALLLLAGTSLPVAVKAQTDVDPPKTEEIGPNTEIEVVTPTNTMYATRGLSQTGSAEALGEGRLVFGLTGAWYQQDQAPRAAAPGNPQAGANIFTGIGAASFGVSPYIDAFAAMSIYGSQNYTPPAATANTGSGLGTLSGGIQATLPFNPSVPFRMAGQAVLMQGLSNNPINTYRADGYNYMETRTGLNFMAKLLQTMVFGSEDGAFKMHFNEGIMTSTEGRDPLMLLATGVQFNTAFAALGLELNSRTSLKDIELSTDPLWVTPSVQFRTPYSVNATLGADIALSQDRDDATVPRALEPYRVFAGVSFSFDTQAAKRQRIKDEERRKAAEANRLKQSNQGLAQDAAASKAAAAAAAARQKASADSLAALTSKSRQDSAAMANKARQDSIALAEAAKRLAEEKAKRSDAEKQLLSTGLLLMDAVYFETGKTDISINSKPYLNIIAKMLVKYPKLNIEVSGHTDNVGGAAYNQNLSQGRSQSVRDYMVSVAPELSGHLSAKGYGMTQPKASNANASGRTLNRRTELQVLNKDALAEYNR
jgi:outer membrane protein OmpA-like peptidoglycan-associated protein